jgi:hypothetical protein
VKFNNRCRHFTGTQNTQCRAGITYATLPKGAVMQCIGHAEGDCQDRSVYTAEELAEQEREHVAAMQRIGTARKAITDRHGAGKPSSSIADMMPCPCCHTGTLYYRIASYNGHIHAACTTEGCVRWME